jgi:capsular polysaccharide biosynthesis protein
MSETEVLVSIHGAALTNMMFMPQGGKILELIPYKNGLADFSFSRLSLRHDRCYVELARVMGHTYNYLECRSDAPWYKKTHMANLIVDMPRFEDFLQTCSGATR